DLRDGTEGALPADPYLIPALYLALDFALDRQVRMERVGELLVARGSAGELAGERQAPGGRDDDCVDPVADRHLEPAVFVSQLVQLDDGFALAADVYKRHVVTQADDRPLDGLAFLVLLRLVRSLEHRCKVVFRLRQDP